MRMHLVSRIDDSLNSQWLLQVSQILQGNCNIDCRSRINPPRVTINTNHIGFLTNKRGKSTFLNNSLLKLDTILPYVPLLSTETTLGFLFYVSVKWFLSFITLVGFIGLFSLSSHEFTFSYFH